MHFTFNFNMRFLFGLGVIGEHLWRLMFCLGESNSRPQWVLDSINLGQIHSDPTKFLTHLFVLFVVALWNFWLPFWQKSSSYPSLESGSNEQFLDSCQVPQQLFDLIVPVLSLCLCFRLSLMLLTIHSSIISNSELLTWIYPQKLSEA